MNIVEKAIKKESTQVKLAAKISELTQKTCTQPNIATWKKKGYFPSYAAHAIVAGVFNNEISIYEACPEIWRVISNG